MKFGRLTLLGGAFSLLSSACATDGLAPSGSGGGSSTGGSTATGGATLGTGGATGGVAATGGNPSGGQVGTGGSTTGGTTGTGGSTSSGGTVSSGGSGGTASGGTASGGSSTGGSAAGGSGGTVSSGGSGGAAGGSGGTPGALPMGNPPVKSSGCGKGNPPANGKYTINSNGQDRTYIIDIPAEYDPDEPHRLFYTSHWIGSTSEAVRDQNYYFLKPLAQADNVPAIFIAPQSDGATWQEKDHALFDALLAFAKENLCIDETRVFATGFSFGGMITYSLSVNHQQDIRAAVGIAPANYNIYVPEKSHEPIAWMHTTGMSDGTCPWVFDEGSQRGAKFIAIEHATDNGCTVPNEIPAWQSGGYTCYEFEDCMPEYPTRVCTFGGGHTNIDNEGGQNWIPRESWDFFMRF